jgi:hypothetical protein
MSYEWQFYDTWRLNVAGVGEILAVMMKACNRTLWISLDLTIAR